MSTDNTRQKRITAGNALATTLFVVGAVVLVNIISFRKFGHLDLTEAKMYTLSQASKDLVKGLGDPFTITAFISEDLPPQMKTVSQYTRDLISEYASASGGKLRFEAIDPRADKKNEEEATRCQVRKVQLQV